MPQLSLSVLDQSVWLAGSSEGAAIRDTLALAQHCEGLGCARFRVSEHHGLPTIIGSAPEILLAASPRAPHASASAAPASCWRTTAH